MCPGQGDRPRAPDVPSMWLLPLALYRPRESRTLSPRALALRQTGDGILSLTK